MMVRWVRALLWTVLLVAALGCSDARVTRDSEPLKGTLLSCDEPAFVPCGGDPRGHWLLDHGCLLGKPSTDTLSDSCAITDIGADLNASGFIEFNDDGSFRYQLDLDGVVGFSLETSCLAPSEGCSALDTQLQLEDLTCTGVAALGCNCAMRVESGGEEERGLFETVGGEVILGYEESLKGVNASYCRKEDQLLVGFAWSELEAYLPNAAVTLQFRER